jgi:2-oxoglutarate dehydrogenase E1 component
LVKEGTITKEEFNSMKMQFKNLLQEQFKTAKEYKPKLEWYAGVCSRYKPERGKDRRGVTGVSIEKIKKIKEKITTIPKEFNPHSNTKYCI